MCKNSKTSEQRCSICRLIFFLCLAVSVLLIVGGFFSPPMGQIDGSVLTAVGELLMFPTIAYGFRAIDAGLEFHFQKGDVTVNITKDDD